MSATDLQRDKGDTEIADSDIEDAKMSANEAETNSDETSGEYKEAFEDVGTCPLCGQEGPLFTHCTNCNDYELWYSVVTVAENDGMNEKTDEELEAAIASAEAFSRDIAVGAQGAILADVEVESSTESNESNSKESNN